MAIFSKKQSKKEAPKKSREKKDVAVTQESHGSTHHQHVPHGVIVHMYESEKANRMLHKHCYTFVVASSANKTRIKETIEKKYNVKVAQINTISKKDKQTRFRGITGKQSRTKRAIVTLKEGFHIEHA